MKVCSVQDHFMTWQSKKPRPCVVLAPSIPGQQVIEFLFKYTLLSSLLMLSTFWREDYPLQQADPWNPSEIGFILWVYFMGLSNRIGYCISSIFFDNHFTFKNGHKLGYSGILHFCKKHLITREYYPVVEKSRCRKDVCRWHVGADGAELSGGQWASHGTCGEPLNQAWIFVGSGSDLRFLLNIESRAHINRVLVLALDGFDNSTMERCMMWENELSHIP
jgi:hypothetical protein